MLHAFKSVKNKIVFKDDGSLIEILYTYIFNPTC